MLAHPGQRRADAESIRVIVSGVVGKSAGVKSTATAFLVPFPFPSERETRISSSDTGHYRTCPSSFSREREREREEMDSIVALMKRSNHLSRPLDRLDAWETRFIHAFISQKRLRSFYCPRMGHRHPMGRSWSLLAIFTSEFSSPSNGKFESMERCRFNDHFHCEWICRVNFFFFLFRNRSFAVSLFPIRAIRETESWALVRGVSVDLEEGESRVIYKRVKVFEMALVHSKINLSFVKWYIYIYIRFRFDIRCVPFFFYYERPIDFGNNTL